MYIRSQIRAGVRPGTRRGLLRWLKPVRHRRAALAICAVVLTALCMLTAYHLVVPPAPRSHPMPPSNLQPNTLQGPSAAGYPPTQPEAIRLSQMHSTANTMWSAASHSTYGMRSIGITGAVFATGTATGRGAAADAPIGDPPEGAPAPGVTPGAALSWMPLIDDGDATGKERSDAEARALDEQVCAAIQRGVRPNMMRVKHSTVPPLDLPPADDEYSAEAPEALDAIDPYTYQFPFRVPEVPGARSYGDVRWCPGSLEPPPEEVPPVDPSYRALFLIGAQKAGTSWLFHALTKHQVAVFGQPVVDNPLNKHRQQGQLKELQFFNAWPARSTEEFVDMWPPEELAAMRNGTSQKFLFDGSPEYLLNAAVPPRLKQMVPQAKIMVVLRNPTDRAFSAWGMRSGWGHFCDNETLPLPSLCVERSFEATFNAWHNSFARPECRFTTPGSDVSWGECYGCRYNLFRYQNCCALRGSGQEGMLPCFGVPRGFSVVDYSNYAAQLAWWLEFFPPERLFIVTSETLHDETKRVQVLNGLLDFVGLPDVPRFSAEQANAAESFNGHYSSISAADVAAKAAVRRFHAPQVRDLHALLARFWPHVDTSALAQWPLTPAPAPGPAFTPALAPWPLPDMDAPAPL